jgi:hypothetical protein
VWRYLRLFSHPRLPLQTLHTLHASLVEHVLALAEVQRAHGALVVDLDAEEERGGPEVAQLAALSEQTLDLGDLLL